MFSFTPLFVALAISFASDATPEGSEDSSDPCGVELCLGVEEDEDFERAKKLLSADRVLEAVDAFRSIVEKDPEHGPAWFFYAYCMHMSHELAEDRAEREAILERALALHVRAAEFERFQRTALYNAACACALLGRTDDAFDWLAKAFEAGFDRREYVRYDDDLNSLRSDPRLEQYLPADERESNIFLGDVRVLYTFEGESAGDKFGWEGRNAGDCDGDGIADIVISAPYTKVDDENAGRIYVYSGATGKTLFTRTGSPGESLGVGIECAGDVDADGFDDVIAGATFGGTRAGRAYVFSGFDGSTLLRLSARESGDLFGWKVAGVGDFNGDGHDDVAVGAPRSDESGRDAGRAYVFSGKTGKPLVTIGGEKAGDGLGGSLAGIVAGKNKLLAIGAGNGGLEDRGRVYVYDYKNRDVTIRFKIENDENGAHLGSMFTSFVGDVDADGFPDVYASDWENKAKGSTTGRIFVHSGQSGDRLMSIAGEHKGDGFGIGPGRAGDVDGDGHDDVIVGAWRSNRGAPAAGMCTIFSGADGSKLADFVSSVAGDTFGFDAAGLGDLDGDGCLDFLVTAAWSCVNGKKSGRAFVIAGPCAAPIQATRQR